MIAATLQLGPNAAAVGVLALLLLFAAWEVHR